MERISFPGILGYGMLSQAGVVTLGEVLYPCVAWRKRAEPRRRSVYIVNFRKLIRLGGLDGLK